MKKSTVVKAISAATAGALAIGATAYAKSLKAKKEVEHKAKVVNKKVAKKISKVKKAAKI